MAFFDKLSKAASKGLDAYGQYTDKFAEVQKKMTKHDTGSHTMYEVFSGGFKTFALTDNSLVYGKDEYPYSMLDKEIEVISQPTKLTNGLAATSVNGKELTLAFVLGQASQLANALSYANEQIAASKGITKNYKYVLHSLNGSKIEVYDTYFQVYTTVGILGNAMQQSSHGVIITFNEGNASIVNDATGAYMFSIMTNDAPEPAVLMPITMQDIEKANEIINFVTSAKSLATQSPATILAEWTPYQPETKTFALNNENLIFSPGFDELNIYRKRFCAYAEICRNAAYTEYQHTVRDLTTFVRFFPEIYVANLKILAKKAVDVLISNGVYSLTDQNIFEVQLDNYHIATDMYSAVLNIMDDISKEQVNALNKITSLIPNVRGGGFGVKGAVKGIAGAEAFNLIRDTSENVLLDSASKLSAEDSSSIYNSINTDTLFAAVLYDYQNIYISVTAALRASGKDIWDLPADKAATAKNVFQNLTNPNFPQDQLTRAFIQILMSDPFNSTYHQFMLEKFGDNEETRAIIQYLD